MAWPTRIWNTLRLSRLERELEEELRLHVQLSARDLERQGMAAGVAQAEASARLGNSTLQRERMRDMDIATNLEAVGKDLRYALRQLIRNPLFSVAAIASLALGIGANTAVFSILNAVLLKSLPVRDPQELVIFTDPNASGAAIGSWTGERELLSYAEYRQLRERMTSASGTLSAMCASGSGLSHWLMHVAGGAPEPALGRLVTENYFSMLGVEAALGRVFTQADDADTGSDPYAVISYDYWQKRFGGRRDAIGTHVRLYNAAVTIIGVARRGFRGETGGENPDLWVPMMMEPLVKPGRDWIHEDLSKSLDKVMWLHVFGRVKPGMSTAKVQAEANVLFKQIIEDGYPRTLPPAERKDLLDQRVKVREARTGAFGGREQFSQQLTVLLVVSGLVLLIACANVANLLLARATARYKEVGVRLSLGAAKGRLLRQFLTESMLLSVLGGAAGVALSFVFVRILTAGLVEQNDELRLAAPFDWTVLGFSLLAVVVTGLLFGVMPAVRALRVDVIESAKEGGRGTTDSSRRMNVGKVLVSMQVALSLLLVAGAGLFLRTLWNLQSVALGFSKEHLLVVRVDGITAGYDDAARPALYRRIAERLRVLPGVRAVTYSENGIFGGTESGDPVDVEGFVHKRKEDASAHFDQVGPRYFSTLGVPLLLGREIEERDTAASPRVCLVNEAFAKRFFRGRNPLGKHVTDTYGGRLTMEVVGVAKNVRDHTLRGEIPERFYATVGQGIGGIPPSVYFELRSAGDSKAMLNAVRKTILQVNPEMPILTARTADELIEHLNTQPRLIAQLCSVFGAIALLLAAIGLYGVLSYLVARRTNEIGIRMALGAGRATVTRMIFRESALVIALGLGIGLLAIWGSTRLVASRLYGLSAMDPLTITAAAVILGAVAIGASYLPAARAARVSPMVALRRE